MGRRIAALIRHGDYHQLPDVPSAHQPFPLNSNGRQHAVEAAEIIEQALHQHGWVLHPRVDSSNMLRAWQTAEIIANIIDGVSTELESFDALAERGVGCAANLTISEIEAILTMDSRFSDPPENWKSNSKYRLPLQGAESLLEAGQRVAAHLIQQLSGLPQNEAGTLKVFVGHGAAFRHAAFHLGVMSYDDIARFSMFHGRPVFLEYLENGRWKHIQGDWKVRASNSEFRD